MTNCYDKITESEAKKYEEYDDPRGIKCNTEHIEELLNFIPSNYEGMTGGDQPQPTTHQLVLFSALKVKVKVMNRNYRKNVR